MILAVPFFSRTTILFSVFGTNWISVGWFRVVATGVSIIVIWGRLVSLSVNSGERVVGEAESMVDHIISMLN